MKVIILCGGRGIRLAGDSTYIPKAMVKIGHRPIVWHVMKRFASYGLNDFVLALGYKGELIRDYFMKYDYYVNDISVSLNNESPVQRLTSHQETDWKVALVDTGDNSLTGARIARCKNYIDDKEADFMVSYADCLSDVDIKKVIRFHNKLGKVATITGVRPPYREGELEVKKNIATSLYFSRKSKIKNEDRYVNGGYMVFDKKIFSYLTPFNECKLESEVFGKLIDNKQLVVFPHLGFWRWLDTDRDFDYLNGLVEKNQLYWLQNNS